MYLSPSANYHNLHINKFNWVTVHYDFTQKPVSMDKVVHFYVRCNDQQDKYRIIRKNFPHLAGHHPRIYYCQVQPISSKNSVGYSTSSFYIQDHETASWLNEKIRCWPTNTYSSEMALEDQKDGLLTKLFKFTVGDLPPNLYIGEVPYVVNMDIPMDASEKVDFDCYVRRISRLRHHGQ